MSILQKKTNIFLRSCNRTQSWLTWWKIQPYRFFVLFFWSRHRLLLALNVSDSNATPVSEWITLIIFSQRQISFLVQVNDKHDCFPQFTFTYRKLRHHYSSWMYSNVRLYLQCWALFYIVSLYKLVNSNNTHNQSHFLVFYCVLYFVIQNLFWQNDVMKWPSEEKSLCLLHEINAWQEYWSQCFITCHAFSK